jgi:hypothetical protein
MCAVKFKNKRSSLWLMPIILIASGLLLSAANTGVPSNKETVAKAEGEYTPSTPISSHTEEPKNSSAPEGFWTRFAPITAGLSAVLVAIFTGALVFTSWLQWRAIGRQADIAENLLTYAERPYLSVKILEINANQRKFRYTILTSCLWVKYQIDNSGRTPAFVTEMNAVIDISDSATPAIEPPYKKTDWTPSKTTIGAEHGHVAETYVPIKSRSEIMSHQKFAHFFVYVTYEDHLGQAAAFALYMAKRSHHA